MTIVRTLRKRARGAWRYDPRGRTWYGMVNAIAVYVVRCAHMAPRFDGDDDSFVSVWHCYRLSDSASIAQSPDAGILADDIAAWCRREATP